MSKASSVKSQVSANSAGKPAWPADRVERWPIGRLSRIARNARTHSDAQVSQIAASIREWGWTNPVLVAEDGTIIAGHGRVLAAKKLGLAEVPVMVAAGWTEAQMQAYTIADNKLTLNGGWDRRNCWALEIGELQDLGFDLDLVGFLGRRDRAPWLRPGHGGADRSRRSAGARRADPVTLTGRSLGSGRA